MGRHRQVSFAAVLAVASLWASAPLHAQDAPLVGWSVTDDCPSRTVFEAEVERILGRRPGGGPFADITITARGARHAAVLALGTGPGQRRRRIEAASCEAILRAAALIVALEIDPDALSLDPPEPEPLPEPPPERASPSSRAP